MGFLDRLGGFLIAPRATVARLDPRAGAHDGTLLVILYLLGTHLVSMAEALARALAAGNLGGVATVLATFARLVLVPVVLLVLCETLLGRRREHRRGLTLAPFVAVGLVAHAAELLAGWSPPNTYTVPAAGALLAAGLARWVRPAVPPWSEDDDAPTPPQAAAPSRRMPWLGRLSGGAVLMLAALNVTFDLERVQRGWASYGPLSGGAPLPEVALPLLGGGTLRTQDLKGRVTVLSFWASWCAVCRTEMPMYAKLATDLPDGAQVVLVNREGNVSPTQARAIAARVAEERGLTTPVAIDDGRLYHALRGAVLPHTVVVDREGRIRRVHEGRVLERTLQDEVTELLAE